MTVATMDIAALAQQCAPGVHPTTMAALVHVESTFNPFAIGVVRGRLERQPSNKAEAVATAQALEGAGYNFSLGIGQVNRYNLSRYGLDYQTAFEPCANLNAAARILKECYDRAKARALDEQESLRAAFSCYYSGNFSTGFKPDFKGQPSYVQKVLNSAGVSDAIPPGTPIRLIPTGDAEGTSKARVDRPFQVTAVPSSDYPAMAPGQGSVGDSVMVYR